MSNCPKKYIVAFDQGTTSSRAIVLDHDANVVSIAQREFTQIYPQPGWVEHDPMEIWATQSAVWVEALAQAGIKSEQVAAIGITNQRETTIVWDKKNRKTYLQCDCLAKPTNNGNMQSIV
ncbi:glycerol kinase [Acinetobacter baumannii ABNIH6]|nr:glycerol kinase [Acinetobacter baumannii ABNIH6]